MISHVLIGVALTLATVAFVLALWPVVADAPWEEQAVVIQEAEVPAEPSQADICRQLIDALATPQNPTYPNLLDYWRSAGCDEFIGEFAK